MKYVYKHNDHEYLVYDEIPNEGFGCGCILLLIIVIILVVMILLDYFGITTSEPIVTDL